MTPAPNDISVATSNQGIIAERQIAVFEKR